MTIASHGRRRPRLADAPPVDRDPRHEAHVRGGTVWFVIAGLLMLGVTLHVWSAMPSWYSPRYLRVFGFGVVMGAAQVCCGLGLWTYGPVARTGALLLLGLGLLLDSARATTLEPAAITKLVVTAAGSVAFAWALVGGGARSIFSVAYPDAIAREPRVTVAWWMSPLFYVPPLLGVVGALVVFLDG